jgi:hypothetical protein
VFFSKFKNEATMSRAREKIRGTPGNHFVHFSGAFKTGLQMALDVRPRGHRTHFLFDC